MITEVQKQKVLKVLRDSYANLTAEHITEKEFENIIEAIEIVKDLTIPVVMPRFYKTKYSLEKLDEHIHELSCRTEHWIHRGKLEDVEKLIRWRRRYDALNRA